MMAIEVAAASAQIADPICAWEKSFFSLSKSSLLFMIIFQLSAAIKAAKTNCCFSNLYKKKLFLCLFWTNNTDLLNIDSARDPQIKIKIIVKNI